MRQVLKVIGRKRGEEFNIMCLRMPLECYGNRRRYLLERGDQNILKWFGNMKRMNEGRLMKIICSVEMDGSEGGVNFN